MDNEEVISKLKFLAKVQKGEKINVNGLFVQLDGLKTTVSRTVWNVDSRQNTLTFIEKVLANSTNLIELYLNSNNHSKFEMAKNIINDLDSGLLEALLNDIFLFKKQNNCQINYLNENKNIFSVVFLCNINMFVLSSIAVLFSNILKLKDNK